MHPSSKRKAAGIAVKVLLTLSVLSIVWRLLEPESLFAEAACFAMWGYMLVFIAAVPRRFWGR